MRSGSALFGAVALTAIIMAIAMPIDQQQEGSRFSVVKVHNVTADLAKILEAESPSIWSEGGIQLGHSVDVVVPTATLNTLHTLNANVEVMIEDMDALIAQQMTEFENRHSNADYNANYHSVEEITARLQFFANNYPNVDFIETIGFTVEGRKTPGLRFGRKGDSDVPTIYFQCNQHSREWVTAATCMYVVEHMLEGATTTYKELFEGLQFYIVPAQNPDGLTFSQKSNRLWRKNRRQNKDGTYGVDLNRNWANHWGEGGASTVPSSDTYRGPSAFSEPEVINVVEFLKQIEVEGAVVEAAIDFHSYSQLILRPFGWVTPQKETPKNDKEVKTITDELRDIIKGVHGTDFTSEHAAELYIASGGADDWFAAEATAQKKGLTFELRDTGRYGFLLPANQIIPSGEEILPAVAYFAKTTLDEAIRRRAALPK